MLIRLMVLSALFYLSMAVGTAHASVNDWAVTKWAKNTVRYVWEPVNCPIGYINKNISGHESAHGDLWDLGECIVTNVNRVPTTLNPIIE